MSLTAAIASSDVSQVMLAANGLPGNVDESAAAAASLLSVACESFTGLMHLHAGTLQTTFPAYLQPEGKA